ncbi:hypothetical protein [Polynucleobacter necessarius]|uniref:hypothetical protein n=1 Tax=Polynucleobacter necessarius TaxID=576610 RepID=UPI000E0989C3|nr:hypothetical protein [Polynucleobacter necessarius]
MNSIIKIAATFVVASFISYAAFAQEVPARAGTIAAAQAGKLDDLKKKWTLLILLRSWLTQLPI